MQLHHYQVSTIDYFCINVQSVQFFDYLLHCIVKLNAFIFYPPSGNNAWYFIPFAVNTDLCIPFAVLFLNLETYCCTKTFASSYHGSCFLIEWRNE